MAFPLSANTFRCDPVFTWFPPTVLAEYDLRVGTLCFGADAWSISGRTPPDSLYQDCGSDIRHTRLAAIGLEWVPLDPPCSASSAHESKESPSTDQTMTSPQPQPDQPGHIRCRLSAGRSPDGCNCGGIGEPRKSLSFAMLCTAWQSTDQKMSMCPRNLSLDSRECEYSFTSSSTMIMLHAFLSLYWIY